jgi:hypothetical protein
MADDKIALSIEIEADRAQMSLGELEEGFDGLREKLKATNRGTEEGRKQFKELSTQMAQTSAEIKNIELAFEGLDREQVASELGSVAGGISDVTASLVLMGGENETIEQMAASIETAMAISMGMKGAIEGLSSAKKLYNNLLENGKIAQIKDTIVTSIATAKTWLLNTAKKAAATTTGVLTGKIKIATVATRIWNAVLKANPLGILVTVIVAAGAALLIFAKNTGKAAREQKALADSLEAVSGEITSVYEEVNKMESSFELARKGVISKEDALKTYNETIGQTIGEAETLEEAEARFDKNTGAYIEAAIARAQAQELIKMAAEEQTAALLAGEDDNRAWYESTIGFINDAGAAFADYSTLGVFELGKASDKLNDKLKEGATERLVNEKEANALSYKELAKSLNEKAALIEKDNGFISDAAKKVADDKAKKEADDKKEAERKEKERADARAKEKERLRLKEIADAKTLAEFEEEQAKTKIALIQDEGERKRAEIDYNTQLELEALEKKGQLTFDAQMLIAQKKNKALADLEKEEDAKRFAAEQEAQVKRDEYDKLLFDAKVANEVEETERQRLQIEEDFQNNLATLEEQGLLTMELEFELMYAKEQALADIEKEFREKAAAEKQAQRDKDFALATALVSSLSALNDAALATDLLNAAGDEEKKEKIRKASFERQKKLNIAMAAINGAQAVLAGFAQGGLPMAIIAGVTAAAQLAAIVATTYQGGGSAAEVETPTQELRPDGAGGGGGGVQLSPVSNTSTILGNQQVFVTETDITETQNNVSVIEESATF